MNQVTSYFNEQLFDLFSSGVADQAICMLDAQGYIMVWNAGATNFYQYSSHEIVKQPASLLLNGLDVQPYLERAFAVGVTEIEMEVLRKDGSRVPAYLTFRTIFQEGQLQGYAFVARSLAYTQKKQYRFEQWANETTQSSGLFERLISHSYSGITLFDSDLNFLYRSPSAARITGFNDEGRNDITFNDIIHPADRRRIKGLLDDLLHRPGTSVTCKLKSRHYNGHFIDLEGVFTNWLQEPGINAIVLNFHDISERQQAEDDLKQTIAELSAFKHALDVSAIVAITDNKGIIRHVNDNFCKISGYTEQELLGQDHRIINSGYHDKAFIRDLWLTIASGRIWEGEMCNRRKDGTNYWVSSTIVPFMNEQGKPYQYLAIRFDQTEARLAKQELIEKNEQVSSLLESINDAFIALDHDLRYTYVNQRTCELVGLRREDMLGQKIWDLFPDAVGSATWQAVQQALETRMPITNEDYYEPLGLWQENHIYPTANGLSIFISETTWRKREERQSTFLAEISRIFSQRGTLPVLMNQVIARLVAINSSFCLAETWMIGRDGKQLILSAKTATNDISSRFFNEHPNMHTLLPGEGLPGVTWLSGEVEFWSDVKNYAHFLRRDVAEAAGLHSAFGVPLRYNDMLIGVLLLGQACSERPDSLRITLLRQLGDHLGREISRWQLENDMQNIFEVAPDIICIVGTDRYFKKVNPAMCDLLGYSEKELLAMQIDALIHPDDLAESRARMHAFISGDLSSLYFENRYCHSSGQAIHLAWTAAKGKEEGILFCIAKNITSQKEAQHAANQFLNERNTILESIGDAFFSVDKDWIVQYWNHVAEREVKTPKERILGKNLWEVFPDVVANVSYTEYHRAMATGKAVNFEDYYQALGVWYEVNAYPSENGLAVFFRDITSRKMAEQKLNAQAESLSIAYQNYNDLFQLSPMPKFVFDNETLAFLDVNMAAVNHYGYSREEFLGMTLRDIRPNSEIDLLQQAVTAAGRRSYFYQPGTFTHKKKNGELIKVEITSSALNYNGRPARIALAMDVTERLLQLEEMEKQNQRLVDISWMQSHVIRAPLSRIMGLIELFDTTEPDKVVLAQILSYLKLSANELDSVIRAITDNANERDN